MTVDGPLRGAVVRTLAASRRDDVLSVTVAATASVDVELESLRGPVPAETTVRQHPRQRLRVAAVATPVSQTETHGLRSTSMPYRPADIDASTLEQLPAGARHERSSHRRAPARAGR